MHAVNSILQKKRQQNVSFLHLWLHVCCQLLTRVLQVVVVPLRVNVNLKAATVEQLISRRKVLASSIPA